MKKNFILQMGLLGLILGFIVYITTIPGCQSKSGQRAPKSVIDSSICAIPHEYDYTFQVCQSSVGDLIYRVYNRENHLVGIVKQNQMDSLIIADNQ